MAPKKKVEDVSDRPPEGDDERHVTISITAVFDPAFFATLKSPIFTISITPEETIRVELPPDQVAQQQLHYTLVLLSKKFVITPQFVDTVLGGRAALSLLSMPEAKEVAVAPTAAAAKGAKPAPAAKAAVGKVPSSSMETPLDELLVQANVTFDLCDSLTKKEVTFDVLSRFGALKGFQQCSISIVCSDALLASSNITKYLPVVVEVSEVTNLPNEGSIPLEHRGLQQSTLSGGEDTVFVDYEFLGEVVRTQKVERRANVGFHHKKAFFLYKLNRLDLIQKLFFRPVDFEVHDREVNKTGSKLKPPFGVGTVSLRSAVTDDVRRFANSTQILPSREGSEGTLPPADYMSFGTTLKTKIELLAALPKPVYVPSESGAEGEFLSRCLLMMPYNSSVTGPALQAIMGTLVTMKKGGPESLVKEAEIVVDVKKGEKQPTPIPQASQPFRLQCPPGITGFEVMDDERRVMCFEGPLSIVHKLAEVATSVIGDDPKCSVLINGELRFPQRWYASWPSLVVPLEEKPPVITTPAAPQASDKAPPAPGGKKAPPAPPKKKEEVTPSGLKSPIPTEAEDAPPEIDAGGVGGRIRRIRLGTCIQELARKQRNFIKRTLPQDALTCITRLLLLRNTKTILQAVDFNLFPTTQELISLERVHGQTLELMDVCGSNEFVSFAEADVSNIVQQAQDAARNRQESNMREVDITNLSLDDVGLVVSFEGIPATAQQCPSKSFDPIFAKLRNKAYMFSLKHQKAVLCAFSAQPPKQVLRHQFTAQMINCNSVPVLFVIDFQSLAKNSSDHLNPAFEEKLRKDKRRAPAGEYFKMIAEREAHYNATHMQSSHGISYRDDSSDDEDGFVDVPPQVTAGLDQVDLIPNYVVLNKRASPTRQVESHADTTDFAKARELYDKQTQNILKASASVGTFAAPVPFLTTVPKTAAESRQHPLAPSLQRVDDLKQPWQPPASYKGLKAGSNPFRYDGAKNATIDKEREKSVFGGLTAAEKKQEEFDQKQRVYDEWKEKIVVDDPSFKVSCKIPSDAPVSQVDKYNSLLDSEPQKLSMKKTFVPSAPPSIFTHEKIPALKRVERTDTKHPENKQFYYPNGTEVKVPVKPIAEQEKRSPLYGADR